MLETDRLRLPNWSGDKKPHLTRGRSTGLPRVSSAGFGVGYISDTFEKPSPIVERIKNIVRQTANAVNIEGIGSSLLRSLPVISESPSDSTTGSPPSAPATNAEVTRQVEDAKQDSPQPSATKSESAVEKDFDLDPNDITNSLARLLHRFPSSKCLETLNFAGFKKDYLALRSKGNGQPEKNHPAGVPLEPIFKRLTDEIKALQANVAVHDQFAKESVMCYQGVLLELLMEMESLRTMQDARISQLENAFYVGPWLATFWRFLMRFLWGVIQLASRVLQTLIQEKSKVTADGVTSKAAMVLLFVAYLYNRRRMHHSWWLSRKIQQPESDLEKREPAAPPPPILDETPVPAAPGSPSSVVTQDRSVTSSSYSSGRKKLAGDTGQRKRRPLAGRLFAK